MAASHEFLKGKYVDFSASYRTFANASEQLRTGFGWGARIRTWEWRNQNPLPYHLATPQSAPDHTCGVAADQSSGVDAWLLPMSAAAGRGLPHESELTGAGLRLE
jgi:hypothetical protein